jgi:Taurine catabolism dioxygenase TauD, TfdA family
LASRPFAAFPPPDSPLKTTAVCVLGPRYPSRRRAELDYHVDGSDIVGLYCLQTALGGGISRIASSVAIHNEILRRDPDLVDRLYEPFPYNRQNEEAADEAPFYMAPIYSLRDGKFAARYIRNHVRASQLRNDTPRLNERDHRALDIIQDLAESDEFHFDMVLEQGDMQFLNNHVMIHSRTQFEDHEDPTRKRHLLRLWLSIPNGRPLCEGLRGAYKAVEPNTVRGGFKGQHVTPELRAYQARAAAALGMRDTPY